MKTKNIVISLFITLIFIGGSFIFGFYFGKSQCAICPPEDLDFSLFWEAYYTLKERFVDAEKIGNKQILYGAISGMVKSLNDPYTIFLPPDDSKRFLEDVKGQFEGIGIEIGIKKGQLQVISPLEGTPAQKAGLKAGDKILAVNGTSTADLTIEEAVNLIRGPKGTSVTLTIFRSDWEKPKEVTITRDIILIPSLKWELKDGEIAYLKIYQFSEKAIFDFDKVASQILNSPAKKIILDLRNNPGGYLEVAQDIAGWFVERGKIVAIEDFGGKRKNIEYKSKGNGKLGKYPIIVLINQGSASASEILAGCLRDNLNVQLIGEKSFGKGSVQELKKLKDNSSLKITVAKWLTPKGELITDKGLEPDIKVEMESDEEKDLQLEKALEIIKNL